MDPRLNFSANIEKEFKDPLALFWNKYFLPSSGLKLYYAFVHPQLLDRRIVWGSTYSTCLKIFPFFKTMPLGSSEGKSI